MRYCPRAVECSSTQLIYKGKGGKEDIKNAVLWRSPAYLEGLGKYALREVKASLRN